MWLTFRFVTKAGPHRQLLRSVAVEYENGKSRADLSKSKRLSCKLVINAVLSSKIVH